MPNLAPPRVSHSGVGALPFEELGVRVSLRSPRRSNACTSSPSRTGTGRSARPWEHCAEVRVTVDQNRMNPDFHHGIEERLSVYNDEALASLLYSAFRFSSFRPNQEAVCRAAIQGRDVLLVMPTGSGKSLCYQLPGIVRGGTTLVISP